MLAHYYTRMLWIIFFSYCAFPFVLHASNSQVGDSVWHLAARICSAFDIVKSKVIVLDEDITEDLSSTHTVLQNIFNKCGIVDSKVDAINLNMSQSLLDTAEGSLDVLNIAGLMDTFTLLEVIEDKLSNGAMGTAELEGDFQETWTNIQLLENKFCTIDSKVDVLLLDGINLDQSTILESLEDVLDKVCFIEEDVPCSMIPITSGPATITNSGHYCIGALTTGPITISTDNVTLDLQGNTLDGSGGNGVVVSSGYTNIAIRNGCIDGVGTGLNGIWIDSASCVTIDKITMMRFDVGLRVDNSSLCIASECDLIMCTSGAFFENSSNCVMRGARGSGNIQSGISLVRSSTNCFFDCKMLETMGTGNTSVYGFVSQDGTANIFDHCTVDGMGLESTLALDSVAAFAFLGRETNSVIMNSFIDNVRTLVNFPTNPAVPLSINDSAAYAILFDLVFSGEIKELTTVDTFSGSTIRDLRFSPDGLYVHAISGSVGAPSSLQAFAVDDFQLKAVGSSYTSYAAEAVMGINAGGNQVAITAHGTTLSTTGTNVEILDFNAVTGYSLSRTITHNAPIRSVTWAANESSFVFGGDTFINGGSPFEIRELRFFFTPGIDSFISHGGTVRSISSQNSSLYGLFAGDVGTSGGEVGLVKHFNDFQFGSSLTTVVHGATVHIIRPSKDGTFFAIGGEVSGGVEVRVYKASFSGSFGDNITATLLDSVSHGATVRALSWDLTGQLLLVGGDIAPDGKDFRLYRWNGSTLTLLQSFAHGATVRAIDFSPNSELFVVAGDDPGDGVGMRLFYSGAEVPEECVAINNGSRQIIGGIHPSRLTKEFSLKGDSANNLIVGNISLVPAGIGVYNALALTDLRTQFGPFINAETL